jgi:hypothetical protein
VHFGDFDDPNQCFGPSPPPPLTDAAEDADVTIHEYGHAIHGNQIPGWSFGPYPLSEEAGAMGEGFGDFLAGVMNNNPCIGEYVSFLFTECGGSPGLRSLQHPMTYPAGYEACPNDSYDGIPGDESEEVHCGGLIWGAVLWDLVENLGGGSPTQQSRDTVLELVLEAQFFLDQQAKFNEAASAICLADNLLNSGANAATIASVFAARGLSTGGCTSSDFASLYVRVVHTYGGDLEILLKVGANVNSPLCTFVIATADLSYGAGSYLEYEPLGPCAGFLAPTVAQPWWVQVRDGYAADTGHIANFDVLLTGGRRCYTTDPPVFIQDGFGGPFDPPIFGAAAYAKVDCTAAVGPTPTPPPTPPPTAAPNAFGNVDCGGGINSIDALKILRHNASLSVAQTEPCEDIEVDTLPNGELQGDVDCSGGVDAIDALKLLRNNAALPVAQNEPCPNIGT